jgi:hypothetical protein
LKTGYIVKTTSINAAGSSDPIRHNVLRLEIETFTTTKSFTLDLPVGAAFNSAPQVFYFII